MEYSTPDSIGGKTLVLTGRDSSPAHPSGSRTGLYAHVYRPRPSTGLRGESAPHQRSGQTPGGLTRERFWPEFDRRNETRCFCQREYVPECKQFLFSPSGNLYFVSGV